MGDVEHEPEDLYDWIAENMLATAADVEGSSISGGMIDVSKPVEWADPLGDIKQAMESAMKDRWATEQEKRALAIQDMLEKVPPQMRRDPLVGMLVTIISNGYVCPPSFIEKWKAAYERGLKRAAVQS